MAKDQKYRKAYDAFEKAYGAFEEEFGTLTGAIVQVRLHAGLTQQELARRTGTTQEIISRLESGCSRPSMRTLKRISEATESRLLIAFVPLKATRSK